ncbi:DUF1433 domain-containing protein [Bacillus sp. SL00103]
MEQYIKEGYQSIEQIDFSSEYHIDPTGGVEVTGYLNNDRNKKFSGIYDPTNEKNWSSCCRCRRKIKYCHRSTVEQNSE